MRPRDLLSSSGIAHLMTHPMLYHPGSMIQPGICSENVVIVTGEVKVVRKKLHSSNHINVPVTNLSWRWTRSSEASEEAQNDAAHTAESEGSR